MSVEMTRTNILNAAEKFFAEQGFHATSLRQITEAAGANVASVNYHFGGKEKLLDAVLKRRLEPLNTIRFDRLKAVREEAAKSGVPLSVREIYRAFLEPTMGAMSTAGGGYLALIMGRVFTEAHGVMMQYVAPILTPLLTAYTDALCEAVPERHPDEVMLRFRMSMGAMHHAIYTLRANQMENIPDALRCSTDSVNIVDMLIDYVSLGMEV